MAWVVHLFRHLTFTVATFGEAFVTSAHTTIWLSSGFIEKAIEKFNGVPRWELAGNG
jgi:hypothetical protein